MSGKSIKTLGFIGALGCILIGGVNSSFADTTCYVTVEKIKKIGIKNPPQMCFPHRAKHAQNRDECVKSADKDLKSIGYKRTGICHSEGDCWIHEEDCYKAKVDCHPCDAK